MVKWTPKSEKDLDEILEYIAFNINVDMAVLTIEEIIIFVNTTLSINPLAGSIVETNPLFYKLNFKGNTIYYCENPKDKKQYIVYVHPRNTDLKIYRINNDDVA